MHYPKCLSWETTPKLQPQNRRIGFVAFNVFIRSHSVLQSLFRAQVRGPGPAVLAVGCAVGLVMNYSVRTALCFKMPAVWWLLTSCGRKKPLKLVAGF